MCLVSLVVGVGAGLFVGIRRVGGVPYIAAVTWAFIAAATRTLSDDRIVAEMGETLSTVLAVVEITLGSIIFLVVSATRIARFLKARNRTSVKATENSEVDLKM